MNDTEVLTELISELKQMGIKKPFVTSDRVKFRKHHIEVLNLSNLGLERLPNSITKLEQLNELYLSNNSLSAFPSDFTTLSNLEGLDLTNNKFIHFPEEILELKNLYYLNLEENDLDEIPFELIYLDLGLFLTGYNPRLGKYSARFSHFDNVISGILGPEEPHPLPFTLLYKHLILKKVKQSFYKGRDLDKLISKIERLDGRSTDKLKQHLIASISDPKKLLVMRLTDPEYSPQIQKRYSKIKESNPILEELEVLSDQKIPHYHRLPTDEVAYTTHQQNITGLSLSSVGLIQFPVRIIEFSQLETLILDNNKITFLPSEIDQLDNLSVLSIKSNQLNDLPRSFSNLSGLEYLILSGNDMDNLSLDLSKLTSLRVLVLDSCNLSNLQSGITDLSNLEGLVLSNNPELSINQELEQLEQLKRLHLANTGLSVIPFDVTKLQNLENLDLSENSLSDFPKLESLPHLVDLKLQNNDIDIPRKKQDLSHSKFDS